MRIAALLAGAAAALVLAAPHLWAAPAPPKPVERVVYALGGELWSVAPNGSDRRRLSRTRAIEDEPVLSPDGSRLAFEQNGRILVARSNGTAPRRVTVGPSDGSPSWSPDGRSLAFVRDGGLWTITIGAAARRVPLGTALSVDAPDWSPDGARIAFAGAASDGNVDVYAVTPSSGELARMTTDAGPDTAPVWARDGRIAYVGSRKLYVVAADATVTLLTPEGADDACAAWAPDGARLVVLRSERLRVIRPDGSVERDLGAAVSCPDWGLALPPSPQQPEDELLPDLDPRAPSNLSVIAGGGRQLLGFDSAVDSVGRGPIWLRGRRTSVRTPLMEARQLVTLTTGGSRIYRRIGSMRYTFSPTHIHWHYLDFVRYELRRASDFRLVVRDYKTGFCLGDNYGHAGGRVRVAPPRFTGNCGQGRPDLLEVEQGNSVGYTDRYPSYFHGQYVELTRVPAGLYVLVHRANPGRQLRESNYANNASSVLIRLTRTDGRAAFRVLRTCQGTDRCLPTGR